MTHGAWGTQTMPPAFWHEPGRLKSCTRTSLALYPLVTMRSVFLDDVEGWYPKACMPFMRYCGFRMKCGTRMSPG